MRVVAFNGSPRPDGNTSRLIHYVFEPLEKAGISCELVNLAGKVSKGCTACLHCRQTLTRSCVIKDDIINECIEKMVEADGILIGSPTYFANVTAETKALIDRVGYVCRGSGHLLRRKVGAAVVSVRRAGSITTFNGINDFFLINEMIIPGSSYWNLGVGGGEGEVDQDKEGIATMTRLGENMAWLLGKIE